MFTCTVCTQKCDDSNSVICDVCRNPVHVNNCAELSPSEVDCIRSKRRKLHFFCSKCDLINVISNLSAEFDELKLEIAELKTLIKSGRDRDVGNSGNNLTKKDDVTAELQDQCGTNDLSLVCNLPDFVANISDESKDDPTHSYENETAQVGNQSHMEFEFTSQSETHNVKEEVMEDGDVTMENLLPQKSKKSYTNVYNKFSEWRTKNNVHQVTEIVIQNYIDDLSKLVKPSSLWSYCSMLKTCLINFENIDIGRFPKVKDLLRQNLRGFQTKKSKFLSREEVYQFLNRAPDELYLLEKTVLVMGVAGACRIAELINMKLDDVDDRGSVLVIKLPDSKTNKPRIFTVINETDVKPIDIYRKYRQLRPKNTVTRRLFLNYRNGKCTVQPVGINKIGKMPKIIAKFLGLPEANLYTGHAFRRISTSFSTDSGSNPRELQRRGRWASNAVEENDFVESVEDKIETESSFVKFENTSCNNFVNSGSETSMMPYEGASTSTLPIYSPGVENADSRNIKLEPGGGEDYNIVLER